MGDPHGKGGEEEDIVVERGPPETLRYSRVRNGTTRHASNN